MRFHPERFVPLLLAVLVIATAAGRAQTSISSNSSNAQGGQAGGSNSGSSSGSSSADSSASAGSSQGSPYPGWAPQAGPIADIPFTRISAAVSFDSSFYQGSVLSAPATSGVLNLSLDDAIRRGLDYNLALRIRRDQEQVSIGQSTLALQPLLPVITASATTALTEINLVTEGFKPALFAALLPPGITIPSTVSFQSSSAQLNLNWSAFNYPAWKQFQAARVVRQSSASATADSQQTVILNVARAYLQVLASFSQLQNAQVLLQADQQMLNDTVQQHLAGVVANLDELRARVQFQTQQQVLIADRNDLAKKNIALERMIGLDPAQQINLTEMVPYAELDSQPSLPQMRQAAWSARDDYRQAQQLVHAAELQRSAARAERLPTLTFGGYYGVIGITYASYHGNFAAQANLKFPIFQEAKLRGDRVVAEQQVATGRIQAENLKQQIDADLRNASLDYDSAKSLVAVARANVDLANIEIQQASDRFKAGVSENLPVTDAQATLAGALTSLVNSEYQFNLAKLSLARALGTIDRQYAEYLRTGK